MYNIEYHNNPIIFETINNDNFNPNHGLRKKSFIDSAVEYNNFDIFKLIINHSKFDYQKVISKFFLSRIITRTSLADIPENRRYLDEIYNLNINIPLPLIKNIKGPLFFELFEKINKNNFHDVISLIALTPNIDLTIFEFVFKYIKNNFPDLLNKQIIDNNFLQYIYHCDYLSFLMIIKNEGYDISCVNGKDAPELCEGPNSKCLAYLANENITYNNDILLHLEQNIENMNWYSITRINVILTNLVSNLGNIKKLYPNFNNKESNILLKIINKYIYSNNYHEKNIIGARDYGYIIKSIELCFNNLKINNPVNNILNIIKISKKAFDINNVKDIVLKLIYHNGNLNEESNNFVISSNIFKKEELDVIKKTAECLNKPKEIVIKKKKGNKKEINLKL